MKIVGIGTANAQEVETDEAPPQARSSSAIFLVGRPVRRFGIPLADHSFLVHNSNPSIPCVSNVLPTCNTIAATRENQKLVYAPNDGPDQPFLSMLYSTVERPFTSADALWDELSDKGEAYDNDADYAWNCLGASEYNSNSFVSGIIDVVNAFPGYDMSNLVCGEKPLPATYFQ